jgi:outer membrane receptor protein involved in Fe transport
LDSRFSFEIPLGKEDISETRIKFGGAYMQNERNNSQVIYRMEGASGQVITGELDELFPQERFSVDGKRAFDLKYINASSNLDSDIGISKVIAAFGQLDYHFNPRFRFVGGLRVETTDIVTDIEDYYNADLPVDDPQRENVGGLKANPSLIDTVNFLPSTNFIYNLVNNDSLAINLRVNYFNSLARPSFRELSPVSLEDYELRARVQGNTNLEMTSIHNFDFRMESYFASGDNISVSFFYKYFKNHIELIKIPGGESYTWNNADNSRAFGLEIEGKKQLLPSLDIRANLSLIDSKTTITVPVTKTRSMFGQSPFIVNGILTYTADSARFSISASYNVQGAKIAVVANTGSSDPDVYEMPRHMLDLNLNKKLGDHFSVTLNARNILNAPLRRSYKFDAGWLLDFDNYAYGTSFSLTIAYKL